VREPLGEIWVTQYNNAECHKDKQEEERKHFSQEWCHGRVPFLLENSGLRILLFLLVSSLKRGRPEGIEAPHAQERL
jgi:hypothetical protein